jgi:hypothetical protein
VKAVAKCGALALEECCVLWEDCGCGGLTVAGGGGQAIAGDLCSGCMQTCVGSGRESLTIAASGEAVAVLVGGKSLERKAKSWSMRFVSSFMRWS